MNTPDIANGLGVEADFDHLHFIQDFSDPRNGLKELHISIVENSTALEAIIVLLRNLEGKQIRSDYICALLHPHVDRLSKAITQCCELD